MHLRPLIVPVLLLAGLATTAGFAPRDPQTAGASAPASADSASYAIDAVHSTALFRVHHLGAGQFWGRFNQLDGTFTYADGSDSDLSLEVTIPISSVDTNSDGLDKHLKSPDFFNVREFPAMTFRSTSAKKVGERSYLVTGEITIRDTTRTIEAEVEWTGTASSPRGTRCGLEARFSIQRSVFGVNYGVEAGMLGDEVRIIVGLEGVRQ